MALSQAFGIKVIKLQLQGDYPTIRTLYQAIRTIPFEAGPPQLVKQRNIPLIAFPELDRNNQVQIIGDKGRYQVIRSAQPAGLDKMAMNLALNQRTDSWSGLSGAFSNPKKLCMQLVENTAETIRKLEL